jgi:hypothetical protein
LDGYMGKEFVKLRGDIYWRKYVLDKATLEIEEFRKKYPLKSDGLVVTLGEGNQLLMASYGKPPLSVVVLRPGREWLKVIGGSSDDAIRTLNVEAGDVVVVGSLGRIARLRSGTVKLDESSTPDLVIKTVYDSAGDRSICIVVAIAAGPGAHDGVQTFDKTGIRRSEASPKVRSLLDSSKSEGSGESESWKGSGSNRESESESRSESKSKSEKWRRLVI